MVHLSLRIDLSTGKRVGPGKVALLEAIQRHGSISAGGRTLQMSYRRAWTLVEDLNRSFGAPVVMTQSGGRAGGGARLTRIGRDVVRHYRAVEHKAERAAAGHLHALQTMVSP